MSLRKATSVPQVKVCIVTDDTDSWAPATLGPVQERQGRWPVFLGPWGVLLL